MEDSTDFEWNGSWRDIYVPETSEADWQTVWDVLRGWGPPAVFTIDGITEPMPARVETVLKISNQMAACPHWVDVVEKLTIFAKAV